MPKKKAAARTASRKTAAGKRDKAKSTAAEPKPIRAFSSQAEFENWLEKNHRNAEGVWIRFAKKGSGVKSVSYPEALESALCYGWIDALVRPESETTYLHRFLPRREKSLWSKINREKALGLIAGGRMRPPGLAEVERAKRDGRWESAYDSPSTAKVPPEFERELDRHPKAKAFFETLNRVNRYAIIWRLQTARTDATRQTRVRSFIEMLEKGETLH